MKNKLNIKKGTARKKMIEVITSNPELSDFNTFIKCITRYCSIANTNYDKLDGNFLSSLQFIRLLTDGIYSIYGLLLADDKHKYIYYFMENKAMNQLKGRGEQLTTNVIGKYAGDDYEGLDTIYKESCRYLHPSIFFDLGENPHNLKENQRGILTPKSIWETDHLKGQFNNKTKVAFIIDTLNNILYDVVMRAYNEAIVPLYPELSPINYNRNQAYRKTVQITKDEYIKYVNKATRWGVNKVNTIDVNNG